MGLLKPSFPLPTLITRRWHSDNVCFRNGCCTWSLPFGYDTYLSCAPSSPVHPLCRPWNISGWSMTDRPSSVCSVNRIDVLTLQHDGATWWSCVSDCDWCPKEFLRSLQNKCFYKDRIQGWNGPLESKETKGDSGWFVQICCKRRRRGEGPLNHLQGKCYKL